MIPDEICVFLEKEASVAMAATRDAARLPFVHRISGWRVEADRAHLCCLVPDAFSDGLLENLEDNGQFAVTIEEVPSHVTYQFKGDFVDSRAPTEEDVAVSAALRHRFAGLLERHFLVPPGAAQAFTMQPGVAVRFTVREIFLQTPGPDAGKRLLPAEDA